MKPWWERMPERFELEKRSLDEWGVEWELDPGKFAEGWLWIRLMVQRADGDLELVARYPDTYPYTRFEVIARGIELEHHQGPFEKNLCLLGQHDWDPAQDTLASVLQSQLEKVIETGSSDDAPGLGESEVPQGEPLSEYYSCIPNTAVLIDGSWAINPANRKGTLMLGYVARPEPNWLGAVIEVRDENGRIVFEADPAVKELFPRRIAARWVRSDEPIVDNNPARFDSRVVALAPELAELKFFKVPAFSTSEPEQSLDVIAVIQPEEHSYRSTSDGWIFLVRRRVRPRGGLVRNDLVYLARADRYGRADLQIRIPELSPMDRANLALVGLGCIGAPSALQFARSGVGELRILDHDRVDAGTTVRWPFGISVAGAKKIETISTFIRRNHPYTRVVEFDHRLGSAFTQPRRDNEILPELIRGSGLLYDASASLDLQHLLSDLAREWGTPYVGVNATFGGWGGTIVRIRPGVTEGCWACLEYEHRDGLIPRPPRKCSADVQPAGCGSPTFEAASFDVESIGLVAVRLAISTLCSGSSGAYPPIEWDVAIMSLRDDSGLPIPPETRTFPLRRHPECPNHR